MKLPIPHLSFHGWLSLLQSFLNEDETYTSRKESSFLGSFDDAQNLYNEFESFIRERLGLDEEDNARETTKMKSKESNTANLAENNKEESEDEKDD